MTGLPIAIAGAGIGGLAAALCLTRACKRVVLLERAHFIEEVGAGLQIAPNAGRALAALGLEPVLAEVWLEPAAINVRRGKDGAVLARLALDDARERWGAPFRVFHRADLQQALLAAARAHETVDIRTGARVGDFEEESGVVHLRVHTDAGMEDVEAAGLVGADGVRSSVRAHLFRSEKDAPVYSGHTAWRAIIPAGLAPAALRLRETHLWLMRGAHVVHYPLRDASILSAVVILEDRVARPVANAALSLDGPSLARMVGLARLAPQLRDLIEAGASWRHWPLFARPALPLWSKGAVTLLGDAAHPMLPFLAQGAAQAIEDAEALGYALARFGSTPASAFVEYERARNPRATQVQSASRRQGAYFHMGGLGAAARDLAIAALGGRGMLARNAWIYR